MSGDRPTPRRGHTYAGAWFILCLSLMRAISPCASAQDNQQVLDQARHSYYNVKDRGLTGLRCDVLIDWEGVADQIIDQIQGANPRQSLNPDAQREFLSLLEAQHFSVVVGPNGASTVSHTSDKAPPNERSADALRKVNSGIEQMITGFLEEWATFTFSDPFPKAREQYETGT